MKPMLTKESFADWCAKQPAKKQYYYEDSEACACAQYGCSIGLKAMEWRIAFNDGSPFWREADRLASYTPHTFEALAARLRGA